MEDKKEYEVSEEIVEMFEDMRSYYDCRDSAIKNCFTWKRAAYYAKRGNQERDKAWRAIIEIYPELAGVTASFNFTRSVVIVG
jgi:hypothetical protein